MKEWNPLKDAIAESAAAKKMAEMKERIGVAVIKGCENAKKIAVRKANLPSMRWKRPIKSE